MYLVGLDLFGDLYVEPHRPSEWPHDLLYPGQDVPPPPLPVGSIPHGMVLALLRISRKTQKLGLVRVKKGGSARRGIWQKQKDL